MGIISEDFSHLDCSILLFYDIDMSISEALKSMYFYSRGYPPPGVLVALVSRKEYRRNQRDLGMHLARTQCFMKTGAVTRSGGGVSDYCLCRAGDFCLGYLDLCSCDENAKEYPFHGSYHRIYYQADEDDSVKALEITPPQTCNPTYTCIGPDSIVVPWRLRDKVIGVGLYSRRSVGP
jgi:hypothetical protein